MIGRSTGSAAERGTWLHAYLASVGRGRDAALAAVPAEYRAACAALVGVAGASIDVGGCALTEGEVEFFVRALPKSSSNRSACHDKDGRNYVIFSFTAEVDGVRVHGQGDRDVTREELERLGKVFSSNYRYLTVDEALRGVADAPEAQR